MRKQIWRKYLTPANRGNYQDTHSQEDPVSLIKGKERTLGIKIARRKYHLPVVKENMMTVAVVIRNQIEESPSILKTAKKLICQ